MSLNDHPTVKHYYEKKHPISNSSAREVLKGEWLKKILLDAGADDAGFVEIDRKSLGENHEDILRIFPKTKTIVSFVGRLNPANIRCVSRAISDTEYIEGFGAINATARNAVRLLQKHKIEALYPSAGFPMELEKWPGKMWPVSHKPLAVEAGLGQMGLHRLVIHPQFGNFILLGTLLLDRKVDRYDQPLDYNPCIDCKLCSAVCPVGAIGKDGHFSFSNCMTHNYRDRMGGFSDWVENIATSQSQFAYRQKVSDPETVSMWQSLSYGICNKSSYCMAVCPAGDEVVGDLLEDRKKYTETVVRPLQMNDEMIFVVPGSDAEAYTAKRYPHKKIKRVSNGLRPHSVKNFLDAMPLIFQRKKAKDLQAVYFFTFTGEEKINCTVTINKGELQILDGHHGKPDIHIKAESKTWIGFLAKEKNLMWALLRGKIKIKGSPVLMKKFAQCFPG